MEVVKTSIWKLVKDCQLKRPHLKYNQKRNICSHALTSRFVFCFSVFSLRLLHHHPTFDPPPLKFHYNLSCSAFSTAPPVIFEVYETSAHVRVCVSALRLVFLWIRDREKKHRLFSAYICQTHHLWQNIRRLMSLHLAVTLATAGKVNCQLG